MKPPYRNCTSALACTRGVWSRRVREHARRRGDYGRHKLIPPSVHLRLRIERPPELNNLFIFHLKTWVNNNSEIAAPPLFVFHLKKQRPTTSRGAESNSIFACRRDICDFSKKKLVLNLVESPFFTVGFRKQKVRGLLVAHKYYVHARRSTNR